MFTAVDEASSSIDHARVISAHCEQHRSMSVAPALIVVDMQNDFCLPV